MTSSAYAAIRDDKSSHSLSLNERDFLRGCAHAPATLRIDGRRVDEVRKVRLKLGRWYNGAECTVQWGAGTRVTSLCSAEMVPPLPDRPNEGIINFTVDLSPMAGAPFRQAASVSTVAGTMTATASKGPNYADRNQRLLANRILRSVERIIVVGGAFDAESLVVTPGSWVWKLTVSLTLLDDGGNVLDACVLAAVAALRHYRKPQVDIDTSGDENSMALPRLIPGTLKEPTPLALHHTPVSISFALLPALDVASDLRVATLVDPEKREELVQFGTLSIAMNVHGEVCLLDFGGGHELAPEALMGCVATASTAVQHLCKELEATLDQADQVARKETLQHLQQTEQVKAPFDLSATNERDGPFLHTDIDRGGNDVEISTNDTTWTESAKAEAEEVYRMQALDYTRGHQATSLREDSAHPDHKAQNTGSALLATLMKVATNTKATGTI